MSNKDMLLRKRMQKLNPSYSMYLNCCIRYVNEHLDGYLVNYPDFSDHSILHSERIINYTNHVFSDIINTLNIDEVFCYLAACFYHDIGMGLKKEVYIKHRKKILPKKYWDMFDEDNLLNEMRYFHNYSSAYWVSSLLEKETSKEFYLAHYEIIATICKCHRKVDIYDEEICPSTMSLDNGNTVRTKLLSLMLRLCDALDIGEDRVKFTSDEAKNSHYYLSDKSISKLKINDDSISFNLDTQKIKGNENDSLDDLFCEFGYCKRALFELCDYQIRQDEFKIKFL